ncbi:MAG: hypothetical protein KAU21_21100 [Gammaproteobacteria bacterium]|nr:hypothetical protein [Gammaproteobacteria bacterium]
MNMKSVFVWLLVAISLLLNGCEQTESASNVVDIESFIADGFRLTYESLPDATSFNIIEAHHEFAFINYRTRSSNDTNTISAPFDLQQLLAMIALGAEGITLDTFSSISQFVFNEATYNDISIWEQEIGGLVAIERERFLWGQINYLFSETYLQNQSELFGPVILGLDFMTDYNSAITTIDDMLNNNLSFTAIGDLTRLVLAQSKQIVTSWSPSITSEQIIGRFGKHEEQHWVEMVQVNGLLNTAEGENYRAVELPFAEPGLSMVMITPTSGQFDTVRNNLNSSFWNDLLVNLTPADTTVFVPQLLLEGYNDGVPDLGVALVENGSTSSNLGANFSGVNNAGFLYLEPPLQHISLTIDELGLTASTTSAAIQIATENEPDYLFSSGFSDSNSIGFVSIFVVSQPVAELRCFYPPDQSPFIFAIYDIESKTLLHLGQVLALNGLAVEADWIEHEVSSCGDSPVIYVYQYSGNTQCDYNGGTSLAEMKDVLINAGVDVPLWTTDDASNYSSLCGTPDGAINVFGIHESQFGLAESLGFYRLNDSIL